MNNKHYTVRPDGNGVFVIVDASTGTMVNRFNLPGQLVNGPIVSGDTCSVVTQTGSIRTGFIIKIPTGNIINRFSA